MSIAKSRAEIQRDYERRSGYSAQKKYLEKVVTISLKLHQEKDADIIAMLDGEQPLAVQIKQLIRKKNNP